MMTTNRQEAAPFLRRLAVSPQRRLICFQFALDPGVQLPAMTALPALTALTAMTAFRI